VAAGAIARKILASAGVDVYGFAREIGGIRAESFDRDEIERNIVRSPDPNAAEKMIDAIMSVKEQNDSLGGIVEVHALNVPVGLGEPTFDKLDGLIGHAMHSIPAVKGVEIGEGFDVTQMRGSQSNDSFTVEDGRVRTRSNNSGGILGGLSSGETIVVRVAVKPTSSVARPQQTVDTNLQPREILVEGRHDPSVVPRAVPVCEAMLANVLADLYLRNRAARINWPPD
jgi:chorismate synthase